VCVLFTIMMYLVCITTRDLTFLNYRFPKFFKMNVITYTMALHHIFPITIPNYHSAPQSEFQKYNLNPFTICSSGIQPDKWLPMFRRNMLPLSSGYVPPNISHKPRHNRNLHCHRNLKTLWIKGSSYSVPLSFLLRTACFLKCWYLTARLHEATTQKTTIQFTAVTIKIL
jgi:hypothetical protein